ncbi:MAG: hypothetical protein F4Y02_04310 [Chloroflexi bacterium]|nr:hypothetical protein [Chloroflexota bacterium]
MINHHPLFFEPDLDSQLRARERQVAAKVDGIPESQFLVSSDQDVVEHVVPQLTVEPIVLQSEAAYMNQTETQVDVSGDPMRNFRPDRSGPFRVPGTRVDIDIPYIGEDWIFGYRTNPYSAAFPSAKVDGGFLRISISLPHDAEPERFREIRDCELGLINECVDRAHAQVTAYNGNLASLVHQAITDRRSRLGKHAGIAELLDIPLSAKPGAPSIAPVRVVVRRPPALPIPPRTGLAPEPGITSETYEHILRFIRHQGRTFERTPGTYALHSEEGLRNIILAQLNGHFEGAAMGEVFRGTGKTDICIETDSRAAFVGECKLWAGPARLTGALDQLLGYLTWRDGKASVVLFNTRNRNFSRILPTVPEALRSHALFVRDLPCDETGEWRVLMRSREDEGRRVTVHVFLFDLYEDSGGKG